jgi:hypothetical protein
MMHKSVLLILVALAPTLASAFMGGQTRSFAGRTSTSLNIGPLKKITNKAEYEQTVNNLMRQNGYSREQAEKEYNAFLDNPNDYALQKVSVEVFLRSILFQLDPYYATFLKSCRVKCITAVWATNL